MKNKRKEQGNTNHSIRKIIGNTYWILKFVCKYSPSMIIFKFIRIPFTILEAYIGVNFTRWILEKVEINEDLKSIILFVILVLGYPIIRNLIAGFFNILILPRARLRLSMGITKDVVQKVKRIDELNFESPKFFDTYTLGLNEINSRAVSVLDTLENLLASFGKMFVVTTVVSGISSNFAIFGFLGVAIEFILGLFRFKLNYKQNIETTPEARKIGYVSRVTYQPEFSSDMKIHFGFIGVIMNGYKRGEKSIEKIIIKFGKKSYTIEQFQLILKTILIDIVPWILIVYLLFNGRITIPEVTVLSAAALSLPNSFNKLLSTSRDISIHSWYIQHLRNILEYKENIEKEKEDALPLETVGNIEFKDVSFAYANDAPDVLKNVSLSVERGDKIALVGYNGAGKTTLAKLLIRLFDATKGSVTVNGNSIGDYNTSTLRSKVAYMGQDFKIYSFSIAENILMRPFDAEKDTENVVSILKKVGLLEKVLSFKNGINTYITKEFEEDGEYFSGGEMQKLALARVYAGNYDYIILDESTSALDPVSEDEIIKTIFSIFADKTIIMISHRLATIKYVNRVCFMANGQIEETGTHQELMQNNGNYAQFYLSQAEKYDVK